MAERRVTTAGEEVSQQPQRGHPSEYILYDDHEISVLAGPDPTAAESWEAVVVRSCIRVTCANDADECELSLLVLGDNGDACGARGTLEEASEAVSTIDLEVGEGEVECHLEIRRSAEWWILGGISAECHQLMCGSHASLGPGRRFSTQRVLPVTEESLRSCGRIAS
jgi:hypothetical protein